MRPCLRAVCALLIALTPVVAAAEAPVYTHHVYIDTDDNPATGCTVLLAEAGWSGQVTGVERDLAVSVTQLAQPLVSGIQLSTCSGASFGAPGSVSAGGWPVGLGVGRDGADVVEAFVPRSSIAAGETVRLYFHSHATSASDVLLAANGRTGSPLRLGSALAEAIPLATPLGLALLASAVAVVAFLTLRRRGSARSAAVAAGLLALGIAAVAVAATISMDGAVADWAAIAPLGVDSTGDSSAGDAAEDIVAGFATADANNLYFRIDVVAARLDTDLDGVPDSTDNCPGVPNPTQADTDSDGTGDACDVEECDGVDNDGDGQIDEGVTTTYYQDADGDTYGNASVSTQACSAPAGYVADNTDCNDTNSAVHPGASETCNGVDDDCDGSTDEGVTTTYYQDADTDTYGNASVSTQACSGPAGYVADNTDCNDTNSAVHPGAAETCNGVDDDCDGSTDEGVTTTYYQDADTDTYGNASVSTQACSAPAGYVADNTDCNDSNSGVHPGATETCNGVDDDCDGSTDEALTRACYSGPAGTAGVGVCHAGTETCAAGEWGTCADQVLPGAERCNGLDDDCDDSADNGFNVGQACTAGVGTCQGNGVVVCDIDGNGSHCNASAQPDGTACDDGSACTQTDSCQSGTCTGSNPVTCTAQDQCHDAGACNPVTGACSNPNSADGKACDDGSACTTSDTCQSGACVGGAPPAEACGGGDEDCDGSTDEENATGCTWYLYDGDGDGFGVTTPPTLGPTPVGRCLCAAEGSWNVTVGGDCNDGDANVHPGATEVCNGVDDDCDGSTDEGVTTTYYQDADTDGYGNAGATTEACSAPSGYVSDSTDCDDADAGVNPGASESCNGVDDDCDGSTDEENATGCTTYYYDSDGDGYGTGGPTLAGLTPTSRCLCAPSGNWRAEQGGDCDDGNASIYPGATEICNEADDDCNGSTDEGVTTTFYLDGDGDSYGDPSATMEACSQPAGYVFDSTDCNDGDSSVNPGATEVCNGIDDDCDGSTDEGATTTFYYDGDSDGFGDPSTTIEACSPPTGYMDNALDCDDSNSSVFPGAPESYNNMDDNCDGSIDEGAVPYFCDADGDLVPGTLGGAFIPLWEIPPPGCSPFIGPDCNDGDPSIYPGASDCSSTPDGVDNDCSTVPDDQPC